MSTPYRDDTDALTTRLGALLDQLEVVRAQKRGLEQIARAEEHIEQEIEAVRRKLERSTPARRLSLLEHVEVASPCPAAWDSMVGDDRSRFCAECSKSVHNIAGMSREEAEAFLAGVAGDVCIRIFRRADGTVLTSDCPVGVRRKQRRRALVSVVGGSLLSAGAVLAYSGAEEPEAVERVNKATVAATEAIPPEPTAAPQPTAPERHHVMAGKMARPDPKRQMDYQTKELVRLMGERARASDPAERRDLEAQMRAVQQRITRLKAAERSEVEW
jgi:hypothetical protein